MTERKELPTTYLDRPPTVGREDAIAIIDAVMNTWWMRRLQQPDPDQLVEDIAKLQAEYLSRKMIDSMHRYSELEERYTTLKHAANILRTALAEVSDSWSAHYFLVDAQDGVSERRFEFEYRADAMMRRLVSRTDIALKAVKLARGAGNSQRWYELAEGDANAWLYDIGIPDLFRKTFGCKYSIHASKRNPGVRFINELAPRAGFPVLAQETLKGRLKKARKKGG